MNATPTPRIGIRGRLEPGIVREAAAADTWNAHLRNGAADMRIGDTVIYQGKRYVLRGLDPMGMVDRRADLEDAETGERIRVPVTELEPA